MNLEKYVGKYVRLIDFRDLEWTGYVMDFIEKDDDDPGDSIGLFPNKESHSGAGFFENDIKFIEEITESEVKWGKHDE